MMPYPCCSPRVPVSQVKPFTSANERLADDRPITRNTNCIIRVSMWLTSQRLRCRLDFALYVKSLDYVLGTVPQDLMDVPLLHSGSETRPASASRDRADARERPGCLVVGRMF